MDEELRRKAIEALGKAKYEVAQIWLDLDGLDLTQDPDGSKLKCDLRTQHASIETIIQNLMSQDWPRKEVTT